MSAGSACGLAVAVVLVTTAGPGAANGQSLGDRLSSLDGEVTFHYKGRDGIEGCGDGSISLRGDGDWMRWNGGGDRTGCGPGPVEVIMDMMDGEPRDLDVRVGPEVHLDAGRDHDLGRVSAPEAAEYLLQLAETGHRRVAEDAVFPAFIADSAVVWPRLIALARDRTRPEDVRTDALFWVGQEAAGVATEGLAEVALDESEDQDIRESAVFALSQRPEDESTPILMEIAVSAPQAGTRKSAMFWLAQSDDPEVTDFFEDVLLGRRTVRTR